MLGVGDKPDLLCNGKFLLSPKSKIVAEAYKRSGYENLKYDFFRISAFCNVT